MVLFTLCLYTLCCRSPPQAKFFHSSAAPPHSFWIQKNLKRQKKGVSWRCVLDGMITAVNHHHHHRHQSPADLCSWAPARDKCVRELRNNVQRHSLRTTSPSRRATRLATLLSTEQQSGGGGFCWDCNLLLLPMPGFAFSFFFLSGGRRTARTHNSWFTYTQSGYFD